MMVFKTGATKKNKKTETEQTQHLHDSSVNKRNYFELTACSICLLLFKLLKYIMLKMRKGKKKI